LIEEGVLGQLCVDAATQAAVVTRVSERAFRKLDRLTPWTLDPSYLAEEQQSFGEVSGVSRKIERRLGD
jgi:hypothetical protein